MVSSVKDKIIETKTQEINDALQELILKLSDDGLLVEFGTIGQRTTYALIYDMNHTIEVVGYTFLRDLKYYKENVGRLKALQQAIARKQAEEERREDSSKI